MQQPGLTGKGLRLMALHPGLGRIKTAYNLLMLLGPGYMVPGQYNLSGWDQVCTGTPLGPIVWYNVSVFNPNLVCGAAFDVPDGPIGQTIAPGSAGWPSGENRRWISFGSDSSIGPAARQNREIQYQRSTGLQEPVEWLPPVFFAPNPGPVWVRDRWEIQPWADPGKQPVERTDDPPQAPPWRLIPHRSNMRWLPHLNPRYERSEAGPPPSPDKKARDWWRLRHQQNPRPLKTGLKTKERKLFAVGRKIIIGTWHGLTEANDLVQSLFESMPKNIRAKYRYAYGVGPDYAAKAEFVYANAQHINWATAFRKIIENEIEDQLLGRFRGKLDKAGIGSAFGGGIRVKDVAKGFP